MGYRFACVMAFGCLAFQATGCDLASEEQQYSGAYVKTNDLDDGTPAGAAIEFEIGTNNIRMCDWEDGYGRLPGSYHPSDSFLKLDNYNSIYDLTPSGAGFLIMVRGTDSDGYYRPVDSWATATAESDIDCGAGYDGTTKTVSASGPNSCAHAYNSSCDEPSLCATGTDTSDCVGLSPSPAPDGRLTIYLTNPNATGSVCVQVDGTSVGCMSQYYTSGGPECGELTSSGAITTLVGNGIHTVSAQDEQGMQWPSTTFNKEDGCEYFRLQ